MKKVICLFIFLCSIITVSAQNSNSLVNLGNAKVSLREYYSGGGYERDMKRIVDSALIEVNKLKLSETAAFVFDIDETALSNMSYETSYDFGFTDKSWKDWIDSAKATAIPQVKRFYDSLTAKGIRIIFLTGRSQTQMEKTRQNLIDQGYLKFDTLICRKREFIGKKAIDYKCAVRKSLSEVYEIIGSIGDQMSDLEGGYTLLKIKIPNFMYFIE